MRIEELWRELELEIIDAPAGWLTRQALPLPFHPLLVAIKSPSKQRALLLPMATSAVPARHEWPQCRGLEVVAVTIGDCRHLGVRLIDPEYVDVFTALAEDVATRVGSANSDQEAAATLLHRLQRWQKFLAARSSELSDAGQKGLYGELHILRSKLFSTFGHALSVASWRAPFASHQDFQVQGGALEVKATSSKQPQTIRITSERQLDNAGVRALFLAVIVLDERDVQGPGGGGESLPNIVLDIRQQLNNLPNVRQEFDDRLLEAGYLDADAERFESRKYAVRSEQIFHIKEGFPRIVESGLPSGVGDVSYSLSVASCGAFAVTSAQMMAILQL